MRRGTLAAAAVALLLAACVAPAKAPYVARDPVLRAAPLYLYPAREPARALLFFFGNDVGFWKAHQDLAERFAREGIDVVGFDVRKWLRTLPDGPAHDSAFTAGVDTLLAHARRELGAERLPVIYGGHSIGAEFAIWMGAHGTVPDLVGVLAMSPGNRSHLEVTLADLAEGAEPSGPDSFSVPDEIALVRPGVRIAVVRGQHDKYVSADSAILARGAGRAKRWYIPFGGHSMKNLLLSWPFIDRAMGWLLAPIGAAHAGAGVARTEARAGA